MGNAVDESLLKQLPLGELKSKMVKKEHELSRQHHRRFCTVKSEQSPNALTFHHVRKGSEGPCRQGSEGNNPRRQEGRQEKAYFSFSSCWLAISSRSYPQTAQGGL